MKHRRWSDKNSDAAHSVVMKIRVTSKLMYGLIIILLLASKPLWGAQETQEKKQPLSLAELARQEKERRAQSQEDARLIRNADLGSLKKALVTTGGGVKHATRGSRSAEEGDEDAEDPESTEPDMEFWTSAFQAARLNVQNSVNRRMVLELRMNTLRNAYLQQADGTTRERIEAELAQTYQEVGQSREDEKAARQAVDELELQARNAGLTPGQVRDLIGELPESSSIVTDLFQSADADTPPPD